LYPAGKAQKNRIVKCKVCHLIYANPRKDNVADVEKNHLSENSASNKKNIKEDFQHFTPENHQYLQKQLLQLKDYKEILDFVEVKKKGTFLEIGSYAGTFLNEAKKRGWDVIGIEPLEVPANYSESKLNIKVIREYFENATITPKSIDVIVACHVIEHVPDPLTFLRKISDSLIEGGKLVLETPTYDSITYKFLRHRERSIRCDGHIYFFTKCSFSALLQKAGFKIIKHQKVGRTLSLDRLLFNFGIITNKRNFFAKVSRKLSLKNYILNVNVRDMQRVYCTKTIDLLP
jgi:2-polyprenyl-3-methyl-5-hydroxy-6-metoxy-1,4-benzoquinol methylase